MTLTHRFTRLADRVALQSRWAELEARSNASFFLSWGWIGPWLQTLPGDLRLSVLEIRDGEQLAGLAVVNQERLVRRYGLLRTRQVALNETGRSDLDLLAIEHNGILAAKDREAEVQREAFTALCGGLSRGEWDELWLGGVSERYLELAQQSAAPLQILSQSPSHFVELDKVRETGDFTKLVSKGARKQIRQSMKRYEAIGPLCFDVAETLEQAHGYLKALAELHALRWQDRGHPGAFGSELSRRFHQQLINSRFAHGEVQICRGRAGEQDIGYFYNFVYRGRVYCYQSGLDYGDAAKLRPGVVLDTMAIQHCADQGLAFYDYLHGDDEHKRRLSTGVEQRYWLRLWRRDHLMLRLADRLRDVRDVVEVQRQRLARRLEQRHTDGSAAGVAPTPERKAQRSTSAGSGA